MLLTHIEISSRKFKVRIWGIQAATDPTNWVADITAIRDGCGYGLSELPYLHFDSTISSHRTPTEIIASDGTSVNLVSEIVGNAVYRDIDAANIMPCTTYDIGYGKYVNICSISHESLIKYLFQKQLRR